MEKILFVSEKSELTSYLELSISKKGKAVFDFAESISSALELIGSYDYQYVYLSNKLNLDRDKSELNQAVISLLKKNTIIFGSNPALKKVNEAYYFNQQFSLDILGQKIDLIFEGETKNSDFYNIDPKRYYEYLNKKYNIFIQLNESKFTKVYDNTFNLDFNLDHFEKKGIENFFIQKTDFDLILSEKSKNVSEVQYQFENFTDLLTDTLDYSYGLLNDLDVDLSSQPSLPNTIDLFVQNLEEQSPKEILKILDDSRTVENNFNMKVNTLTMILSTFLASHEEWYDRSYARKLMNASMYHNIEIAERPDLIKVTSTAEFEELDILSKETVNTHAEEAAKKLSKFQNIDYDVVKIVKEQHGSVAGHGINNLPTNNNLTEIFKIASDISVKLITLYEDGVSSEELTKILKSENELKQEKYQHLYEHLQDFMVLSLAN